MIATRVHIVPTLRYFAVRRSRGTVVNNLETVAVRHVLFLCFIYVPV